MPRRHLEDYPVPPGDRSAGLLFIILLGILVGGVALGSGWLSSNLVAKARQQTPIPNPSATAVSTPTMVTSSPVASPAPGASVVPGALDWDMPYGHFFTQTNGQPAGSSTLGFAVTNAVDVPFWDEFRRLGGVASAGYPLSARFQWKGLPTQVFQRVILQWNPGLRLVQEVNTMDELHNMGKDQWLSEQHATPNPLPANFDQGKTPDQAATGRLALLARDLALENFYNASTDAAALYGLPASTVTDMGDHFAIRTQRNVLQHWKVDRPWAHAGQVTAANSGQLMVEAGLLPAEALKPQSAP